MVYFHITDIFPTLFKTEKKLRNVSVGRLIAEVTWEERTESVSEQQEEK